MELKKPGLERKIELLTDNYRNWKIMAAIGGLGYSAFVASLCSIEPSFAESFVSQNLFDSDTGRIIVESLYQGVQGATIFGLFSYAKNKSETLTNFARLLASNLLPEKMIDDEVLEEICDIGSFPYTELQLAERNLQKADTITEILASTNRLRRSIVGIVEMSYNGDGNNIQHYNNFSKLAKFRLSKKLDEISEVAHQKIFLYSSINEYLQGKQIHLSEEQQRILRLSKLKQSEDKLRSVRVNLNAYHSISKLCTITNNFLKGEFEEGMNLFEQLLENKPSLSNHTVYASLLEVLSKKSYIYETQAQQVWELIVENYFEDDIDELVEISNSNNSVYLLNNSDLTRDVFIVKENSVIHDQVVHCNTKFFGLCPRAISKRTLNNGSNISIHVKLNGKTMAELLNYDKSYIPSSMDSLAETLKVYHEENTKAFSNMHKLFLLGLKDVRRELWDKCFDRINENMYLGLQSQNHEQLLGYFLNTKDDIKYQGLMEYVFRIIEKQPVVFSHNDFHPKNIIYYGQRKQMIIDNENSGPNYELFDWAYLLLFTKAMLGKDLFEHWYKFETKKSVDEHQVEFAATCVFRGLRFFGTISEEYSSYNPNKHIVAEQLYSLMDEVISASEILVQNGPKSNIGQIKGVYQILKKEYLPIIDQLRSR